MVLSSISTNNAAKPGCGQDSALTWKLTRLMVIMGLLLGLKIPPKSVPSKAELTV